jgi:hypothetical protein
MALCWALATFQFLNPKYTVGGSARRKVTAYTQNNTNTE